MTETDLAAAVRAVVAEWIYATDPAQQQVQIALPAALSLELGIAVGFALESTGHSPAATRDLILRIPYFHLRQVFSAASLPDTPTGFNPVPDAEGTCSARAATLAVHGFLHIETVSYGTENDGNLFVNLVPMPGQGVFAEKSRKSMRGHTDCVSFPFNGDDDSQNPRIAPSPDLVTLAGLRNPDAVPTRVMPLAAVLSLMDLNDVEELKKPQYSIRSQKTFVQGMKKTLGKELVVHDEPVLKDAALGTYVRYSHSSVVASMPGGTAERASNNLEAACNEVAVGIVVDAGDVLIINNRLSLHGRGEVAGGTGGQSRWLLRAYGLDTSTLPGRKRHAGDRAEHVLFP